MHHLPVMIRHFQIRPYGIEFAHRHEIFIDQDSRHDLCKPYNPDIMCICNIELDPGIVPTGGWSTRRESHRKNAWRSNTSMKSGPGRGGAKNEKRENAVFLQQSGAHGENREIDAEPHPCVCTPFIHIPGGAKRGVDFFGARVQRVRPVHLHIGAGRRRGGAGRRLSGGGAELRLLVPAMAGADREAGEQPDEHRLFHHLPGDPAPSHRAGGAGQEPLGGARGVE